MNNKDLKVLRGQIRQIVKEMLPEVLAMELIKAMEKKLGDDMNAALDRINEQQKQINSYVIRNSVK